MSDESFCCISTQSTCWQTPQRTQRPHRATCSGQGHGCDQHSHSYKPSIRSTQQQHRQEKWRQANRRGCRGPSLHQQQLVGRRRDCQVCDSWWRCGRLQQDMHCTPGAPDHLVPGVSTTALPPEPQGARAGDSSARLLCLTFICTAMHGLCASKQLPWCPHFAALQLLAPSWHAVHAQHPKHPPTLRMTHPAPCFMNPHTASRLPQHSHQRSSRAGPRLVSSSSSSSSSTAPAPPAAQSIPGGGPA